MTSARDICKSRRGLLWVLSAAALATGCVLPIAPEFVEERNLSPFVADVRPAIGTVVTDLNARFDVTVEDPNSNDTLFVRWLIDYPPYSAELSRSQPLQPLPSQGPGLPNRHAIAFQPSCQLHMLSPTLTRHQLMVVISDRPFVEPSPDATGPTRRLDDTPADALAIRLAWTFDKECR
ncbi:MAG TPA: hypothetical protein VGG33_02590 [Polyangia bacterium]